jgi:DNA repair protein RecO (recombination protein O)
MDWTAEGFIIGIRTHGEGSLVVEAMTAERGRHAGLVRGGRSPKAQATLQVGNTVRLVWRGRLDEHLGTFAVEALTSRAARLMESRAATFGLQAMAALLRELPERDPHPELYEGAIVLLDHLDQPAVAGALMVRFEMRLLEELGFGLDLSSCAATGTRDDLVYVSPKSGRAVSRAAGEPYRERLLPLPGFLLGRNGDPAPEAEALAAAFRVTGYFLEKHLAEPRGKPLAAAREAFVREVTEKPSPIGRG